MKVTVFLPATNKAIVSIILLLAFATLLSFAFAFAFAFASADSSNSSSALTSDTTIPSAFYNQNNINDDSCPIACTTPSPLLQLNNRTCPASIINKSEELFILSSLRCLEPNHIKPEQIINILILLPDSSNSPASNQCLNRKKINLQAKVITTNRSQDKLELSLIAPVSKSIWASALPFNQSALHSIHSPLQIADSSGSFLYILKSLPPETDFNWLCPECEDLYITGNQLVGGESLLDANGNFVGRARLSHACHLNTNIATAWRLEKLPKVNILETKSASFSSLESSHSLNTIISHENSLLTESLAAATDLSARVGDKRIIFSWQPDTSAASQSIYLISDSNTLSTISSNPATMLAIIPTPANQEYTIRLLEYDSSNNLLTDTNVTTPSITFISVSLMALDQELIATWQSPPDTATQTIFVDRLDPNSNVTQTVTSTPLNSLKITSVANGSDYEIRINEYDIDNQALAEHRYTATPLSSPTLLLTSRNPNTLTVSWRNSNGAEQYTLTRTSLTTIADYSNLPAAVTLTESNTSIRITESTLSVGIDYIYELSASNPNGTLSTAITFTPLSRSSITQAISSYRTASIAWLPIVGAARYVLYRQNGTSTNQTSALMTIAKGTHSTQLSLFNNNSITIHIGAVNNYATVRSNTISIAGIDIAPATPNQVILGINSSSPVPSAVPLRLDWQSVFDATEYQLIYTRGIIGSAPSVTITVNNIITNEHELAGVFNSATDESILSYTLYAINRFGTSSFNKTTPTAIPLALSNLQQFNLSPQSNFISLNWQAHDDASAYIIYRAPTNFNLPEDTGVSAIATLAATQTFYNDHNIWPASVYFYQAQAAFGEVRSDLLPAASETTATLQTQLAASAVDGVSAKNTDFVYNCSFFPTKISSKQNTHEIWLLLLILAATYRLLVNKKLWQN